MTVVGIGNLILDYYFFDNQVYINGGGTVSNILANLSSMGIDTKICGYYGNDRLGEKSKESLKKVGVDTSLLEQKNYHTKCFFIDKDGYSSTCPYCGKKSRNYKLRIPVEKYIAEDDIVLIQDYVLLENLPNKICLDFGYYGSLIYEGNENIEKFIFREYYMVSIKESVLSFLFKKLGLTFDEFLEKCDVYFLIITRGNKGATIVYKNNIYEYDAMPLEEKETNGCGDIFFATFISEVIKRKHITKDDIDQIFELAQKNVSKVLNHIGARDHLVQNMPIKMTDKCLCEDFTILKS